MRAAIVFLFTSFALFQPTANAARYTLRVGSGSMGTGQANPISFTNPAEYEFTYNTDKNFEWRASPGANAFFGMRFQSKSSNAYVAMGGGFIYDFNSPGGGLYTALGYDFFCAKICLSAEYLQTAGYGKVFISPYFIRIGLGYLTK